MEKDELNLLIFNFIYIFESPNILFDGLLRGVDGKFYFIIDINNRMYIF